MLTSHQAGWLAGIFDGEGCAVRQIHRGNAIIGLSINLTNKPAVMLIARLYGKLGVPAKVYTLSTREGYKPRWSVEIRKTEHVLIVAEAILPLAVVKRHELSTLIRAGKLMLRGREHPKGSSQRTRLNARAVQLLEEGIPPRQTRRQPTCVR